MEAVSEIDIEAVEGALDEINDTQINILANLDQNRRVPNLLNVRKTQLMRYICQCLCRTFYCLNLVLLVQIIPNLLFLCS